MVFLSAELVSADRVLLVATGLWKIVVDAMSDLAAGPDYTATNLVDPFEIHVGPVYRDRAQPARGRLHFRVDERHVNRRGVLHGGMLMTFADLALGPRRGTLTDHAPCVTLNMQTQFLKPAELGDIVEVQPQLMRRTRALIFIRGDFMVDGEAVFTAHEPVETARGRTSTVSSGGA